MAYVTITRIDGDPDELIEGYRRTSEVVDRVGHDHGLILHAGGRTPEGLLLINVWPSIDGSEAAAADPRRLGALQQEEITPDQLRKEHYELERCYLPDRGLSRA